MSNFSIAWIARLSAGLILILSCSHSFGAQAVKLRHITSIYADDQGTGLRRPEGVACGAATALIVADTGNHRLLRFTFRDNAVQPDVRQFKTPQLSSPTRIKLNSREEIFVLDRKQRRIIRIDNQNNGVDYLSTTDFPGSADLVPRSFDIDPHDNIFILDILSARVLVLNPQGKFQKSIPFPKTYGFISDIAVNARGGLLLLDSVNAAVFAKKAKASNFVPITDSLKEYTRFPTSLTTDPKGYIYLLDRNGSRIVTLGSNGSFLGKISGLGWKEGLLNYPAQICINRNGNVFVADTNNSRVQIFEVIE